MVPSMFPRAGVGTDARAQRGKGDTWQHKLDTSPLPDVCQCPIKQGDSHPAV